MEWSQILTLAGINVGSIAVICTFLIWVVNKLDADIKVIGTQIESSNRRLDGHAARIDQLYNAYMIQSKEQAMRTDNLYKMFIDLLKEGK